MSAPVSSHKEKTSLEVVRSVADLRRRFIHWRGAGESVALIPTMGALHKGHLSLVERAQSECQRTVVSVFVNPMQFGPNEDLASYPRGEEADRALLESARADLLYAPPVEEMYPAGFSTSVIVRGLTERLCGAFRPVHFEGVTTVVAKLLLQCLPDAAYFGEKDYQQLQVIRRMVADLDIPIRIAGVEIMRESDGLALSSRNAYLSPEERAIAPVLYRTLRQSAEALSAGGAVAPLLAQARETLLKAGFRAVDYVELCDAADLRPLAALTPAPARLLIAAHLGRTRLIDNIAVGRPARS